MKTNNAKKRWGRLLISLLLLPVLAVPGSATALPGRSPGAGCFPLPPSATVTEPKSEPNLLSTGSGKIAVSRESSDGAAVLRYRYPEKLRSAEFCMVTLSPGGEYAVDLGGDTPVCFTVDENGAERPLSLSALPGSPFFLRADGREWLVMRPQCYRSEPGGTLLLRSGGGELRFSRGSGGWRMAAACTLDEGFASFWYLSADRLADEDGYRWYNDCTAGLFGGIHRLTAGGYFYPTAASHLCYAPDRYYRIPAPHIVVKLAHSPALPAQLCAVAMLDLCRAGASPDGLIPAGVGVDWLLADYSLGPGFYDTRFNTDFAWALLDLGTKLDIEEFTGQAARFAAYLARHAAVSEGLCFSPDYGHAAGEAGSVTHTSLNHQAAEAAFLFRAGDPAVAERLTAAIEATAEEWIAPSGDLWYARTADGSYFGTDYPYLTYNDLYELQLLLEQVRGERSAPIDRLMAAKLAWMETHGVTGYRK